jgi:GNAT superfamily N-acetyltransferase
LKTANPSASSGFNIPNQAECVSLSFPESSLEKKEPLHLRPAKEIRIRRLARRIQPSFTQPGMHWVKAVHIPTNTIIGAAAWADPTLPVHNVFRSSAFAFYGWKEKMGWTDAEVDEIFAHTDDELWSGGLAKDDETRSEVVNEPHWYLVLLITLPEWQGRGVGKRLLDWGIQQADAEVPPTPMYLEASATSRAVYMHVGFVSQGERNFLRRGPKVVTGRKVEDAPLKKIEEKAEKDDIEVEAKEMEALTA